MVLVYKVQDRDPRQRLCTVTRVKLITPAPPPSAHRNRGSNTPPMPRSTTQKHTAMATPEATALCLCSGPIPVTSPDHWGQNPLHSARRAPATCTRIPSPFPSSCPFLLLLLPSPSSLSPLLSSPPCEAQTPLAAVVVCARLIRLTDSTGAVTDTCLSCKWLMVNKYLL